MTSLPLPITTMGNTASCRFDRFDIEAYRQFLAFKSLPEKRVNYDWRSDAYTVSTAARFAPQVGGAAPKPITERTGAPLAYHLFDYQAYFVDRALEARRFAWFADCGLGKGPMQMEFGRLAQKATDAPFLFMAPLSVVPELLKENRKFYGEDMTIWRCEDPEDLVDFCTKAGQSEYAPKHAICNYEKLDSFTQDELRALFRNLGGISLDESSLLKTGGGKRKWALIHGCKGIEFKASATATPAPNEAMEYASQAAFLETLRTEGEVLWTFFSRDDKTGEWTVKPHARRAFYEFLASWSAYIRNPASYGFADNLAALPDPIWIEEAVTATDAQMRLAMEIFAAHGSGLYGDTGLGVTARQRLCEIARGFLYHGKAMNGWQSIPSNKPAITADWVRGELEAGRQTIIWTAFDAEADILLPLLPSGCAEVLDGRVKKPGEKERIIERTETGDTPVLITKSSSLGFGRNLQQFKSMSFFGFDDSFERMYQAVRRAYRYGQTDAVRIHVPVVSELEGLIWSNVQAKASRFASEADEMEACYRDVMAADLAAWRGTQWK